MSPLDRALSLFDQVGRVLVATANAGGQPHLAVAGKFALGTEGQVIVTEWFCPTTVSNLGQNGQVALVIWDRTRDIGFQITGWVTEVAERAVVNGYLPGEEEMPIPQAERELWITVDQVLSFTEAPHTDEPE